MSGVWNRMDELEKDGVFEGVGIGVFVFGGAWWGGGNACGL